MISTKKHNEIVQQMGEEQLMLVRQINQLQQTIQDQFKILNELYQCNTR